jgi:hypothetical protein
LALIFALKLASKLKLVLNTCALHFFQHSVCCACICTIASDIDLSSAERRDEISSCSCATLRKSFSIACCSSIWSRRARASPVI